MKSLILAYLLHHANRNSDRREQFYPIKDRILKVYGKEVGYDIQHIPGKKCYSCGGTGEHARYSMYPPYKPYDWSECWHCIGGWYKLPQWICLARITFGPYTFHRPLKREQRVKNPWTKNEMGWKVTERPVIKGYIEHTETWCGELALLLLFWLYDRKAYSEYLPKVKRSYKWQRAMFKRKFRWQRLIIDKPLPFVTDYYDQYGNKEELPF